MKKFPYWVLLALLCFSIPVPVCLGSEAGLPVSEYRLEMNWALEGKGGAPFYLKPLFFHPDELIGAAIDESGSVYLTDEISDQLVKIDSSGEIEFAVGSVGEGPEDHQEHGEPVLSNGNWVMRSVCSPTPKIIQYNPSGAFQSMVRLDVNGELKRLFWNGKSPVVIITRSQFKGRALVLSTHLALLNGDGAILNQHLMKTVVYDGKVPKPEEDLWEMPRVAVSGDGYVFVQSDHFGGVVSCYDDKLELAWTIEGHWDVIPRTGSEMDAVISSQRVSGVAFSHNNPTIRRMIARDGGEVWIQPWSARSSGGVVELESFGKGGKRLGTVSISGVPDRCGDWIIRGKKLLWMACDEENSSAGTKSYIEVYDLVLQ